MNKLEIINDYCDGMESNALSADGFDDAILGIVDSRIAYSIKGCIKILIDRDGMSFEEAQEYFEFNVEGAYMGEMTPIWVYDTIFD